MTRATFDADLATAAWLGHLAGCLRCRRAAGPGCDHGAEAKASADHKIRVKAEADRRAERRAAAACVAFAAGTAAALVLITGADR